MDKLVLPPAARGAASIADPPRLTLSNVAEALNRPVEELSVVVLDKPRHGQLVATLRACGAAVITPPAGDVAGALAVRLPRGGADLLLGVGGTPEGVLAACAARALPFWRSSSSSIASKTKEISGPPKRYGPAEPTPPTARRSPSAPSPSAAPRKASGR